jgi:hypothetical protein
VWAAALPGKLLAMAHACEFIGHRYRYRTEGATVHWVCVRGCGETGRRSFATTRQARRHAAALNRHERGTQTRRLGPAALAARLLRLVRAR